MASSVNVLVLFFLSLMHWRGTFSKHFIGLGVIVTGWSSFRRHSADFLGAGMMAAVLKQVATLSRDSDMLKKSGITSASRLCV